jgi:hypothetical protein
MLNLSSLCSVCCTQCYQRFEGTYCFHPQCRNESWCIHRFLSNRHTARRVGGVVALSRATGRTVDKEKVIPHPPIGRTKHQPPPFPSYICWTKPNIHTLLTQSWKWKRLVRPKRRAPPSYMALQPRRQYSSVIAVRSSNTFPRLSPRKDTSCIKPLWSVLLSNNEYSIWLGKGKAIPVTGSGGPYGCETSRLPHFLDTRLTDGEVVSLTRRPAALYYQEDSWHSFLLEAESTPGSMCSWKC